jgi:hypothetical protein
MAREHPFLDGLLAAPVKNGFDEFERAAAIRAPEELEGGDSH